MRIYNGKTTENSKQIGKPQKQLMGGGMGGWDGKFQRTYTDNRVCSLATVELWNKSTVER